MSCLNTDVSYFKEKWANQQWFVEQVEVKITIYAGQPP